jgi:alpha-beta hydrolase superfamily lysophospholipase
MQHTTFSWRTGSEKIKIYGQIWQPVTHADAVIALVHGIGEHSGRYRELAEFFTSRNIAIVTFDQRGHGKSEGKRGHIVHFNQLLDGVEDLLEKVKLQFNGKPVILWGHSLGGNIVLNYAIKRPSGLKAVVATAPYLRLAFEPPVFKIRLAKLMNNLYPGFSQGTGLVTSDLSRNIDVVKAYERDRHVHDRISASFFINVYNAGHFALKHANELKVPTLLMHGTADRITSHEASIEFAHKASIMTELKLWEGFFHEIHNEPEREEVMNYAYEWILKQIR